MAISAHAGTGSDQQTTAARCKSHRRREPMQILLAHSDLAAVDRCLDELNSVRFMVNSETAQNAGEFARCVAAQRYDLIVAECPGTDPQGIETIGLLNQAKKGTPLIFITDTLRRDAAREFAEDGVHDCIEMDRIARLPMIVRRVLDEKNLREERDRVEKELRHSKAHYRALVENSACGMCRCSEDGRFLDVNQVLVTLLADLAASWRILRRENDEAGEQHSPSPGYESLSPWPRHSRAHFRFLRPIETVPFCTLPQPFFQPWMLAESQLQGSKTTSV